MLVCSKCGGMVHEDLMADDMKSGSSSTNSIRQSGHSILNKGRWRCRLCNPGSYAYSNTPAATAAATETSTKEDTDGNGDASAPAKSEGSKLLLVNVPSSFRYLTYELACLNVQTRIAVKESV